MPVISTSQYGQTHNHAAPRTTVHCHTYHGVQTDGHRTREGRYDTLYMVQRPFKPASNVALETIHIDNGLQTRLPFSFLPTDGGELCSCRQSYNNKERFRLPAPLKITVCRLKNPRCTHRRTSIISSRTQLSLCSGLVTVITDYNRARRTSKSAAKKHGQAGGYGATGTLVLAKSVAEPSHRG